VSGTEDYHHFTDRYYSSVELTQELDIENVRTHFAFYIYALVAPILGAKHFTSWLGRHLKTPLVLVADIFPYVPTGKG
jgi:hypothetical protein